MRPEVICHIMASVDGRLLPGRWTLPYGDTPASALFGDYAALSRTLDADAWMFGKATTAEVFPEKFVPGSDRTATRPKVHVAHRDSARLFITVDPDTDILYTSDRMRGDNIVTVLGPNACDEYLADLEHRGISYIVLDDATDLSTAMEILHDSFGVRRISLQGGGIIDGAMLAAGLIDRLSIVIYPGIDGKASNPSIFEYIGGKERPAEGQSLQLLSCDSRPNGIVRLQYRIHHS